MHGGLAAFRAYVEGTMLVVLAVILGWLLVGFAIIVAKTWWRHEELLVKELFIALLGPLLLIFMVAFLIEDCGDNVVFDFSKKPKE